MLKENGRRGLSVLSNAWGISSPQPPSVHQGGVSSRGTSWVTATVSRAPQCVRGALPLLLPVAWGP